MILVNVLCFGFSLWVASTCPKWGWLWALNMFAALLNFAIVIRYAAEWL